MASLVFAIIFLGVATSAFLLTDRVFPAGDDGTPSVVSPLVRSVIRFLGAGFFLVIAIVLLLSSTLYSVGTQDVAILTTFGHPENNGVGNGLHAKAPWTQVHTLDDAIQTDTYASTGYGGSNQQNAVDGCVSVRIARQATACVNTVIRWQVPDRNAGRLYRSFKTNDNIRDNLLHRDLQAAVNQAYAGYDPLGINAHGQSTQPSSPALEKTVLTTVQQEVGDDLNVLSVTIPIFYFDPSTQQRLTSCSCRSRRPASRSNSNRRMRRRPKRTPFLRSRSPTIRGC